MYQVTEGTRTDGSYSGTTKTVGAAQTIKAIPARYAKQLSHLDFGVVREGTVKILISSDNTVTEDSKDYRVSWQSIDWDLLDVRRPFINDVVVVIVLTLKKRQG